MDAALVRLQGPTHATLLDFVTRSYTDDERAELRQALNSATAATLARLHVKLAEWASDAVQTLLEHSNVPASELSLIAFPGRTIWHEPPMVSWQLGEPAILAERFGVRVVSGFRARDVAAEGRGHRWCRWPTCYSLPQPTRPDTPQSWRHGQPHLRRAAHIRPRRARL